MPWSLKDLQTVATDVRVVAGAVPAPVIIFAKDAAAHVPELVAVHAAVVATSRALTSKMIG